MVFCCVGNDDDLRAITLGDEGAFAGMEPGAIFVDHTTASAQIARELYAEAQKRGLHFIDAPVSGGQAGAVNGQLTVMCGGDQDVFDRVAPVADAFSRAFTYMGECGNGQLTKMVNQICVAGLVQALSEAIAFGLRADLDVEKVLDEFLFLKEGVITMHDTTDNVRETQGKSLDELFREVFRC